MKFKIDTFKYVRQLVKEQEIELPDETKYFFETGIRRAVRIVPVMTEWLKKTTGEEERIYKYHVTCVYRSFQNKIESFDINAYPAELERLYNSERDNIVKCLVDGHFHIRTREEFENDYNAAIKKFNDVE